MSLASSAVVAIFFSWLIVSSVCVFPHSLSYFNESIGGPMNGRKYLLGSNVDWGQDLRYLTWSKLEKLSDPKFLVYFGSFDPSSVEVGGFQPIEESLHLSLHGPSTPSATSSQPVFREGHFVISANFLAGLCGNSYGGQSHRFYVKPSDLEGVLKRGVVEHIGYSIQVLYVCSQEPP